MTARLYNGVLTLVCFAYALVRGNAVHPPKDPKTILVMRQKPYIGDVVYVTPLFRAIKKTYPHATVILVGAGRVEEVIRHNPDIDRYIPYEGFFRTLSRLRKSPPDLSKSEAIGNKSQSSLGAPDFAVLANAGSVEGLALLFLSGAKCISVFSLGEGRKGSFLYNVLSTLVCTTPFQRGVYVPPLYLKLLDPIQANTGDVHFHLYYSDKARKVVAELFAQHNIDPKRDLVVAIAPGGTTEDRWWPAERFAAVARSLADNHGAKIFLIGAGKDKKAIEEVIRHCDTEVVNLLDQSVDELKAFIAQSHLVVGNDSGPMVIADAFDVPNLAFVGPTDWREYHAESDSFHRIVQSPTSDIRGISLESATVELDVVLRAIVR